MELRIAPYAPPAPVEFNYKEIRDNLAATLEKYSGMIVSEDAIDEAKKSRAALNSTAKILNDRRIEIEREYMKPFSVFKGQINELVGMVKEASDVIDKQVKAHEERTKEQRRADIQNLYEAAFAGYAQLVPLDRVFDAKWLNKGTTLKQIDKDLCAAAKKIALEIVSIRGLKTEYETAVMDKYLQTLDLAQALDENRRLQEQAAALKKLQKEEPKEAPKQETIFEQAAEAVRPVITDYPGEQPKEFCLRLWVTKEQRGALKHFFEMAGIRWEQIKEA